MVMPYGDLDDAALLGGAGASADGQAQPEGEPAGESSGGAAGRATAATATPALTMDDIQQLVAQQTEAIRNEIDGMRSYVDKSFKSVQSMTAKETAQLRRENAKRDDYIEALAKQSLDPEVLEGMTARQREAAIQEREQNLKAWEEYYQNLAKQPQPSQQPSQQSQQPQDTADEREFKKFILPDLAEAASEHGMDVLALYDAGVITAQRGRDTAKDPGGWQAYKKAALAAIAAEGERRQKAATPKPKTPAARPAAAGTPVPAGGKPSYNYFVESINERQRTGR